MSRRVALSTALKLRNHIRHRIQNCAAKLRASVWAPSLNRVGSIRIIFERHLKRHGEAVISVSREIRAHGEVRFARR